MNLPSNKKECFALLDEMLSLGILPRAVIALEGVLFRHHHVFLVRRCKYSDFYQFQRRIWQKYVTRSCKLPISLLEMSESGGKIWKFREFFLSLQRQKNCSGYAAECGE